MNNTLDILLDLINVGEVDDYMVETNKSKDLSAFLGYYYVQDEHNIKGYFERESDALAFRLFLVNFRLNFIKKAASENKLGFN